MWLIGSSRSRALRRALGEEASKLHIDGNVSHFLDGVQRGCPCHRVKWSLRYRRCSHLLSNNAFEFSVSFLLHPSSPLHRDDLSSIADHRRWFHDDGVDEFVVVKVFDILP